MISYNIQNHIYNFSLDSYVTKITNFIETFKCFIRLSPNFIMNNT